MALSMHSMAVDTFVPMLGTLTHLFEKTEEHSLAKRFDVAARVSARLAPDMYPFWMQVQLACYQAQDATARLTGQSSPPLPKDPETLDELKARVQRTVDYLRNVPKDAFEGAEDRAIEIRVDDTRRFEMTGLQLLRDWALPHFYFHVVTAYDILRHHGVDIGKRDYLRHAGVYLRQRG
jgi:hypothetical protein